MTRGADLDLTGLWSGLYSYPHSMPPTPFEAVIRDSAGRVTGETVEPGGNGESSHAMIEGRREGSRLRFVKAYDDLRQAALRIEYDGEIGAGGDEVHGRWQIVGNWSGTFLMIRESGAEAEAADRERTEIRA